MTSTIGIPHPYVAPLSAYSPEALLDELSRQIAASPAVRRLSKGSTCQRPANAMRIVKPTSANNSPRASMMAAKRRTMMHDGSLAWRRQQVADQAILSRPAGESAMDSVKSAPRPVSWHPASCHVLSIQAPSQQSMVAYTQPRQAWNEEYDVFGNYFQPSPMMATYSCQTSPSTFSPLALPLNSTQPTNSHPNGNSWALPNLQTTSYLSPALESNMSYPESCPPPLSSGSSTEGPRSSASADWNSFVLYGFNKTTPPTPEQPAAVPEPRTAISSEEMIPFQSLDAPEEDGEVLVGMGLYDAPEKGDDSFGIASYRPSLLGSGSPGKGLKLEETWQPPPESDDDDDDDDEEEEEEEGEES